MDKEAILKLAEQHLLCENGCYMLTKSEVFDLVAALRPSDDATVRDYFAARFMVRAQQLTEMNGGWDMRTAAQCAYQMADAMLEERKQ